MRLLDIKREGDDDMSKQDLIDLAIEYGMVHSTPDFYSRNEAIQTAILKQMKKVAEQMEWEG